MSLNIWNQLDEIALYQSLERLDGETDEQLFSRMKKFAKWRCKTDYYTQVHTIPIQAGLITFPIVDIKCTKPFQMKLDWEHFEIQTFPLDDSEKEYARIFININDSCIDKITSVLSRLPSFSYTVLDNYYRTIHNKFLVRNNTIKFETEYITNKNTNLSKKNILVGSFRSESSLYCKNRKDSIQDLKYPGDYFLDCQNGYIQMFSEPEDGFFASYRTYSPNVSIEATELNLYPVNIMSKYGLTDDLVELVPYLLNGRVWGH